jgi:ABC-type proline/glycine betaine transport system permease subunit
MENKILQIIGATGSIGAWFLSISNILNTALTTLSLIIGISLGIWALYDRLKKLAKKNCKKCNDD